MKKSFLSALFIFSLAAGLLTTAARADSILIALNSPTMNVAAGGNVIFNGDISAPGTNPNPIYINRDDFNFYGPGSFDDSPFLSNFFIINPGDNDPAEFFDITVPPGTAANAYTGVFNVYGGPTANSLNPLTTLNFTLNVTPKSVGVTPEPPAWLLLSTGTVLIAALYRRRVLPTSASGFSVSYRKA